MEFTAKSCVCAILFHNGERASLIIKCKDKTYDIPLTVNDAEALQGCFRNKSSDQINEGLINFLNAIQNPCDDHRALSEDPAFENRLTAKRRRLHRGETVSSPTEKDRMLRRVSAAKRRAEAKDYEKLETAIVAAKRDENNPSYLVPPGMLANLYDDDLTQSQSQETQPLSEPTSEDDAKPAAAAASARDTVKRPAAAAAAAAAEEAQLLNEHTDEDDAKPAAAVASPRKIVEPAAAEEDLTPPLVLSAVADNKRDEDTLTPPLAIPASAAAAAGAPNLFKKTSSAKAAPAAAAGNGGNPLKRSFACMTGLRR